MLGCLAVGAAQANDPRVIEIGYIKWSGSRFTSNVVQYIINQEMHHPTDRVLAGPSAIYQAIAAGVIDFAAVAWLPDAHAELFDRVARNVVDVGAIYTDARLGWVVPDYVPGSALDSIGDLESRWVMEKLDGKIIGVNPGAGLTRLSTQAMKEYGLAGLGYTLVTSSGPAMTAVLQRAIRNKDWIVVTGRSPHWMFDAWHLRYLRDPKGILGGPQRVDILARGGFYQSAPMVYEMLDRITIPIGDVRKGIHRAERTSFRQAAREYVEAHPELVHYWITGHTN